jgi:hypothetical protein
MKSPSELAYFLNSEQLKAIKGSKYVRESRLYLLHFQQNMGSVSFSISCLLLLITYDTVLVPLCGLPYSVERLLQISLQGQGTGTSYQRNILALRKVHPDIVLLRLRR